MKAKPLLFIGVVLTLWNVPLLGQNISKSSPDKLSLDWATGYIARQDLIFSPFVHTDFSPLNLGIRYEREAKFTQMMALQFANYSPSFKGPYPYSEHGEPKTATAGNFTLVNLDYHFGKRIKTTAQSRSHAGGAFMADIQSLNYVYGRIGHFGYYATLGLGVFGKYNYQLDNKQTLTLGLQLPLVSWLARSPYLVNDDEFIENTASHNSINTFFAFLGDGQLATWNKLQNAHFYLGYTYHLNNRWSVGLNYDFSFIHAGAPRNMISYQNNIGLAGTIKF